jgi:hypothetical protein
MANPNYPPMGGPPMGGPPMGGPPMGGPPPMGPGAPQMRMQRPVRRGTSKAVPVVVSAGLAVGVFCGLLFGVGTGKSDAQASPASGNNVKAEAEEPKPDPGATPKAPATAPAPTPPPPAAGSAAPAVATGSAAPAAGSAAPAIAAGSAAAPAQPTVADAKKIKVTFNVKPEAAAKDAKITIDGKEIAGNVAEVAVDVKSIKLEVKSNGFRTFEKKFDIVGDGDMNIEFEMTKRPTTPTVRPPKRPDRPPSNNGGGLIDI